MRVSVRVRVRVRASVRVPASVCVQVCAYVSVRAGLCAYVYVCVPTCLCIHKREYLWSCMFVCAWVRARERKQKAEVAAATQTRAAARGKCILEIYSEYDSARSSPQRGSGRDGSLSIYCNERVELKWMQWRSDVPRAGQDPSSRELEEMAGDASNLFLKI